MTGRPRTNRCIHLGDLLSTGISFFHPTDNKQRTVSVRGGPLGFTLLSASAITEGTRFTCFEAFAALTPISAVFFPAQGIIVN
jgi:hypothetical protein